MSNYIIRPINDNEYGILERFLYEAIFIPQGTEPPPSEIIEKPELQIYTENFGRKDDYCLVAETDNKIVGAVWVRIMDDYGHIDNNTPSLAISLYKDFRGHGIGTALLKNMLLLLKSENYEKVSLSVQKENYACRMYLKAGFEVVSENDEEYIMIRNLQK
ncbi:MAG: GNAT family N-acetyltransferase [Ruminococcus sp.]|nr:GNAT family N-acetyltransferase [Ruminococcus sp.]